jgi:hypothetical protein
MFLESLVCLCPKRNGLIIFFGAVTFVLEDLQSDAAKREESDFGPGTSGLLGKPHRRSIA